MAITPKWTQVSEGCWQDSSSANPVYIIVNAEQPAGASAPQSDATKGSLYFRPGTTDDYSQVYMKVADANADADWQKILVNYNEEAVVLEGSLTMGTSARFQVRDSTLYIYSPAASTAAIALGASGDVWQIGDQTSSNYIEVDFRGEASLTGTARFNGRGAFEIFDDFTYQAIAETYTPWILNSGSDGQAIDPAISAAERGVLLMTTGDDTGATAVDATQIICHIPVQADSSGLVFETRLHINTAITNISIFAGLTDVTTLEEAFSNAADVLTSNADDACGFLYDTSATTDTWWMVAVDGGTDDSGCATLGHAPVADVYQVLRMEVSADGATINFYIDGTLEDTLSADTGVSPDVNLYATIVACGDGVASKTVDVDYIYVGHNR